MESYRLARRAQDERAEAYAQGYATELATFYAEVESPVTFRAWLEAAAKATAADARAA